jgi:plastocyanin
MRRLAAVTVVLALAAAGPAVGATSIQKRTLSANAHGALRFSRAKLHAGPGVVKIVMSNPKGSGLSHGIAIAGHGRGRIVGPGGTSAVKAKLKRGTYTYYCPFPGHRAAGMKGKLVVS